MPSREITDRQVEAFRRFLANLPHRKDIELVILKAHLLVEEQIRQIIDERLKNPASLADARFSCHQAICLAQSLFERDHDPPLWEAVKKLNVIRNKIAHGLEPAGLRDQIQNLIAAFPTSFTGESDEELRFEMTLWSIFVAVSELVERPSAKVLELVPRKES